MGCRDQGVAFQHDKTKPVSLLFFFCLQHSTGRLRSLHNANQSEFPFRDWLICIDSPSLSNSTKWKTTGEHLGRLDFSQLAQNKINTFLQEGVTVWKVQHESIKMFLSGETSSDTTAWGQISLPDHNSFQLWSDAYVFIGISLSKANTCEIHSLMTIQKDSVGGEV